MTDKIDFRQRREFGDVISVTFTYVRQNFSSLGIALLYVGVPLSVLQGIVAALYQRAVTSAQDSTDPFKILTSVFGAEFLLTLALSLLLYAGIMGVVFAHVLRYISESDRTSIQPSDLVSDMFSNALPILITTFGLGVIIFAIAIPSIFLLFIPVIYISISTAPMLFMRLYEKLDFFAAFSRSFKLVQGRWWQVFGAVVTLYFIGVIISLAFSLPSSIIKFIITFNTGSGKAFDYTILSAFMGAISSFGNVIYYALISIGIAFLYFDLVERKEWSGLMERIDKIAASPSNPS